MFLFRRMFDRPFLFKEDGGGGSGDPDPAKNDPPADPPEDAPDAGETFSKDYVAKLRKEAAGYRTRAQAAETKVGEFESAQKTDKEKADEALSKAQERATYADRLDVALDKAPEGMSPAQIRKLAKRLSGKTREELEADAEELFADFAPSKGGDDERPGSSTPRERLRPGAAPSSEPEETDPRKLAASVPRY